MRVRTSELIGPALDWAVAKCEGRYHRNGDLVFLNDFLFSPSTNWSQAGPIIEREKMDVQVSCVKGWCAYINNDELTADLFVGQGDTPLIAAMRCFVASKLGDEVEIPEELK